MNTGSAPIPGISVSPGVAIGPALVIGWELPRVSHRLIEPHEADGEIERLRSAVESVTARFEELRDRTLQRAGEEEAKIFDAHLLMLQDEEFLKGVESLIRENRLGAEQAFEFKTLEIRAQWSQSSSARLRERVSDLSTLQVRVLNRLTGVTSEAQWETSSKEPSIVFVRELTPALTMEFDRDHIAAFVSERGTRTSHASIIARSLGIPTVVGWDGDANSVERGSTVVVDATRGTVTLDPSEEEISQAREREVHWQELQRELKLTLGQPPVTTDEVRIAIRCNLDLPEELPVAVEHGAEGVGLLRTEFLVMGRTELPSEDEQTAYYRRVVERFKDNPVVIRSYDLGGDKFPVRFKHAGDPNPFLGWRAIRVCLDEPEIFIAQLRAILRARLHGDVRLMLPLITDLQELRHSKELVDIARTRLKDDGVDVPDTLPVGVMVETPAAALFVDQMIEESSFISIGTNDLTQYMLAVDRSNARLAARFDSLHPAVVRALKYIADAAERYDADVSVCGEMAADPEAAFLLLGLGFRTLSVSAPRIPQVRWLVRQMEVAGAKAVVEEALKERTGDEVKKVLAAGLREYVDLDLLQEYRLHRPKRSTTFKTGPA